MNIDLFTSGHGECGMLCSASFDNDPAGVIFDAETADMTIEFLEDAPCHLNIPVQEELQHSLLMTKTIHIGFFNCDTTVHDTISVPLFILNDPYGGEFTSNHIGMAAMRSVLAFEQFMKRCAFAQAIHRDNLGDESQSGSVLKDSDPKNMQFAAALTRQRQQELSAGPRFSGPDLGPSLLQTPSMGGHAPIMGGLAPMGPGGSRSSTASPVRRRPPNKDEET